MTISKGVRQGKSVYNAIDEKKIYCSFCGKSQHEVKKIVAGPTVFICNECVELCDDITWTCNYDSDGWQLVAIKIRAPTSEIEKILMNHMVEAVAESYPELDIKFHEVIRRTDLNTESYRGNESTFAVISIGHMEIIDPDKAEKSIKDVLSELNVMTKKYTASSAKVIKLEEDIKSIKIEYVDYIRSQNIKIDEFRDLKAVMFLDIAGFSKFSESKVSDTLDFVRSIANPVVKDAGGCNLNMWGDAIVATFEDPKIAVKTAIRVIKFLAVDGLDARVGMSWGAVRTKHNPALGRTDIDGETVNEAARIEPLADIGEILTTEEFMHLCGSSSDFEFVRKRVELKKPFATKEAGESLDLLKVRVMANHSRCETPDCLRQSCS